jgi:hypothetical protein
MKHWSDGSTRWALPSRAVPVLDGRGRLERATRCEAGKSARRFLAASSDPVIRVDLKSPQAIIPPEDLSPKRIRTRRGVERSERMSRDDFPPFDGAQGALSYVEARTAEAGPRTASAGAARARQRGEQALRLRRDRVRIACYSLV